MANHLPFGFLAHQAAGAARSYPCGMERTGDLRHKVGAEFPSDSDSTRHDTCLAVHRDRGGVWEADNEMTEEF